MTAYPTYRLPAEWEPQGFVQLTWPHEQTDWAPYLQEAQACFLAIAAEIIKREDLLIVAPDTTEVKEQLKRAGILNHQTEYALGETGATLCKKGAHSILLYECPTNDTWSRDHAFITLVNEAGEPLFLDFGFNGWGQKFASNKDNLINECLFLDNILANHASGELPQYSDERRVILEGGSIESDGKGTVLTTASCLLAPNRNWFSNEEAETMLRQTLNCQRVLWLEHGYLCGDDTDGHVDTLARLCPNDTIVYVKHTDDTDIDYDELKAMEDELRTFPTPEGKPYKLVPLPMASPLFDDDSSRLPATYANFLVINGAVLVPTYNQPDNDKLALKTLSEVFPDRQIIGIDCRTLVRQHGSLHCVTMNYPKGVIFKDKIQKY